MDGESESFRKSESAPPCSEQRSGLERRSPTHRRQADQRSAGKTPELLADKPDRGPAIIRKYHFRSFEDRRAGTDRRSRTAAAADEERLSADEVASLLRQKD